MSGSSTDLGGSCGFEYSQYLFNIFALGAGATYDFLRNFENNSYSGNISFLPIYLCAKLRTPLHGLGNNYFFLSEKLGYSSCMSNSSLWKSITGGLYTEWE
ncbi:MAG: hypothetical protein LBS81_05510 [Endomicrobium sp.]|nr:hypothetical protein [Endomicrobium sp.]